MKPWAANVSERRNSCIFDGKQTVPQNVITVGLILPQLTRTATDEHLEELGKLVESAGGSVIATIVGKRPSPDPATYIGSGKAEELRRVAERHEATLIVFDDDLSPAQVRNLEKATAVKVIDRSALILDIFARRARSREVAHAGRARAARVHAPAAARASGRISSVRPAASERAASVKRSSSSTAASSARESPASRKSSRKIELHRQTQRKSRKAVFSIALVGYTNAGKSTLFNRLTRGSVVAVDKLFATLDAKSSRTAFDMPRETVVIDTVGFIRKLPHHLVASFRSTMEEARGRRPRAPRHRPEPPPVRRAAHRR